MNPEGIQAGGIFVDREAERYLRRLLTQARVPKTDINFYVEKGVKEFEVGLKRKFSGEGASHLLAIAERYHNPSLGVTSGRLRIEKWACLLSHTFSSMLTGFPKISNVVESFFKARV